MKSPFETADVATLRKSLDGDAAVVTGSTTLKGHSGKTQFEGDFQFTDTWVYREGQWKLAASHATRLSK
ncbi:nuclear transport factor 2 family protein [Corallococcus sp. CA049B]|uniref:nuclear transport factor 2 family protein n=1 Tax=Corallococcus sp. CA049B TaxID=2316730 RepID=UPI001F20CAE6|nr:nuclear transport factor 2 family protein [Corallococcus sp. CA049B]